MRLKIAARRRQRIHPVVRQHDRLGVFQLAEDLRLKDEAALQVGAESAKKKVLVLCTGNSAQSQMGEGLFRAEGGPDDEVCSAGTRPSIVRPEAIAAMKEIGIDISSHRFKPVDEFAGQNFDYVVTVCD